MKPVSLSVQSLLIPRILAAFWPICLLLSLPTLFFSAVYFSSAAPRKRKAQLPLTAISLLVQPLTALLTRISVPPALPSLLHEINRDNKKRDATPHTRNRVSFNGSVLRSQADAYFIMLATSAAKSSERFSRPSPFWKRVNLTILISPPSSLATLAVY